MRVMYVGIGTTPLLDPSVKFRLPDREYPT
jgi:hypothetical protein